MDTVSEKTGECDKRALYTSPCVVKISDLKQGAGVCSDGSGDAQDCCNGNTPGWNCWNGNLPPTQVPQ